MKINVFILIIFASFFTVACVKPALKSTNTANQNSSAKQTKQSTGIKQNGDMKLNSGVKLNPATNNDASDYLNFAEAFSNMPADMQKQTLASTNQALALNPNELAQRMKLVMILGLPSSSLADTPKAQNLLQQILQDDILTGTQLAFAHLMFDHLIVANKINKNSHDDSKRVELLQQKNEALQIKLDAVQQKLEISQQKLESSQQKLDELKKIEKSMGERESVLKDSAPKK